MPRVAPNGIAENPNMKDLQLIFFTEIPMLTTMKDLKKSDLQNYRAMMGFQGKVAARVTMTDKEERKKNSTRTSSLRNSTVEAKSAGIKRSKIVKSQKYTSKSNMRSSKIDANAEPIDENVSINLSNAKMINDRLSQTLFPIKEEDENVIF